MGYKEGRGRFEKGGVAPPPLFGGKTPPPPPWGSGDLKSRPNGVARPGVHLQ